MNKPRPVINVEETIGKQVGRRLPPSDPLAVASELNRTAVDLMDAAGYELPRRGVYRYHTHQEADVWKTTRRKKD